MHGVVYILMFNFRWKDLLCGASRYMERSLFILDIIVTLCTTKINIIFHIKHRIELLLTNSRKSQVFTKWFGCNI